MVRSLKGGIEFTEVLDSTGNRATTFTRVRFNYPIRGNIPSFMVLQIFGPVLFDLYVVE